MTLASCLRVVYLQSDPGQYVIGNLMYNLSRPSEQALAGAARPAPAPKYWAPEPVDAKLFSFRHKQQLEIAYEEYVAAVDRDPDNRYFYQSPSGEKDKSKSITSFLCTDQAQAIFEAGSREFATMTPQHAAHRPARTDGQTAGVLSNLESLTHARSFVAHVVAESRRGTPHR
jgi:hypothetical protein